MDYFLHIAVIFSIYATLAMSLDVMVGHGGMLSLAHAGLAGAGAYTAAIVRVTLGFGFVTSLVAASAVAVMISFAISVPARRLKSDAFVLLTFALQLILVNIFGAWSAVTRGPAGIAGIPVPSLGDWRWDTPLDYAVASAGALLVTWVALRLLTGGSYGRVLHALREDEIYTLATGRNVHKIKIEAAGLAAAVAGVMGGLLAHYYTYIDPNTFSLDESILVLAMVIIGGPASSAGPVVGALVLVTLPESLRFIGLPPTVAAQVRELIYGAALVGFMAFRPRGLLGTFGFEH